MAGNKPGGFSPDQTVQGFQGRPNVKDKHDGIFFNEFFRKDRIRHEQHVIRSPDAYHVEKMSRQRDRFQSGFVHYSTIFYDQVNFRRLRLKKLVFKFPEGEGRPENKRFQERVFNDHRFEFRRRNRAAGPLSQERVSSAVIRIGMGRYDSLERNFSFFEHTGDFSSRFVVQAAVDQPGTVV